jgi:hypothetical protein
MIRRFDIPPINEPKVKLTVWAVPGSVDTWLGYVGLLLEVHKARIVQSWVNCQGSSEARSYEYSSS